MLRIVGKRYIIDHILQAAKQEQEELTYRCYIADTLHAMAQQKYLKPRYIEIYERSNKKRTAQTDNRSAEEITKDILAKLNATATQGALESDD